MTRAMLLGDTRPLEGYAGMPRLRRNSPKEAEVQPRQLKDEAWKRTVVQKGAELRALVAEGNSPAAGVATRQGQAQRLRRRDEPQDGRDAGRLPPLPVGL